MRTSSINGARTTLRFGIIDPLLIVSLPFIHPTLHLPARTMRRFREANADDFFVPKSLHSITRSTEREIESSASGRRRISIRLVVEGQRRKRLLFDRISCRHEL